MSNFAVNNSNKTGRVYFGKEVKVVGPRGKIELPAMPSFWTKNIQLVEGMTRSRGDKKTPLKSPDANVQGTAQLSGGGSNG